MLNGALNRVAAGEVRIRTPKFAGMIQIFAAGSGEDANLFANGKPNRWFGGSLRKIRRANDWLLFRRVTGKKRQR